MRSNHIFTSESVSEGHPDKVADQISDAVVDLLIGKDPESRVACECMVTTNRIILAGEVRCADHITGEEIEDAARATVRRIGYEQEGFHWEHAHFANYIHGQSADIAQGVIHGMRQGMHQRWLLPPRHDQTGATVLPQILSNGPDPMRLRLRGWRRQLQE